MLDPNIPKLVLDPATEEELIQLSYNRIETASGGVINDFREGSTVAALVEGQVFAMAELLYWVNLLPESVAIEVFRLYGVERRLGTPAIGSLTFLLSSPTVDGFALPSGYAIPYLDGNLVLTAPLLITAGNDEGTVTVEMDKIGSTYNAPEFSVVVTNTGLGQVQSITNREPLTGGTDLEPLEDLIKRCQRATVQRQAVVTKADYETTAVEIMAGGRAIAVPNLSPDGVTAKDNSVCVFCLGSDGKPATQTTLNNVSDQLKDRVLIGTDVTALPAVLELLTVEVFCNVSELSDALARSVLDAVNRYLNPATYNYGIKVYHNEIAYAVRQVSGVTAVDTILINGEAIDYLLPQEWYYPYPNNVIVTLSDGKGNTLELAGGLGNGDFLPSEL